MPHSVIGGSSRQDMIRVAVIGNSNSVMRGSFARLLNDDPQFEVTNKSIGSSPSVVLLDFLALETDLDYDFIVVETSVVDMIQGGTLYPRWRSEQTLEIFIHAIKARSRAQIIILVIPTRYGLLAPAAHWQEPLYKDVAMRFGIPILNGFRLVRDLIGHPKMAMAEIFMQRSAQLVGAFGFPPHLADAKRQERSCKFFRNQFLYRQRPFRVRRTRSGCRPASGLYAARGGIRAHQARCHGFGGDGGHGGVALWR